MVTGQWLRMEFPSHDVPQPHDLPEPRGVRSRYQYDIEDLSMNERVGFVSDHGLETTNAVLGAIEKSLKTALDRFAFLPGAKGGRRRLEFRHYFLVNVVEIWRSVGKPVKVAPGSLCVAFCESIVEAIGWPTEGIAAAVRDAVDYLLAHPELSRAFR